MQPAYLDEEHLERLRNLMLVNKRIVIENHIRDYLVCFNYFTYGLDFDIYENMLCSAFAKIEKKLKYSKKKLYIFDDYHDIYEDVVEITIKKAPSFNGSCLFSTWVYGIMKNVLLRYYHKKSKLREVELIENVTKNNNLTDSPEEQIILKEALESLSENQRWVFELHFFKGYTPLEISQRSNKSSYLIEKILNQAIDNLRKYYKS